MSLVHLTFCTKIECGKFGIDWIPFLNVQILEFSWYIVIVFVTKLKKFSMNLVGYAFIVTRTCMIGRLQASLS